MAPSLVAHNCLSLAIVGVTTTFVRVACPRFAPAFAANLGPMCSCGSRAHPSTTSRHRKDVLEIRYSSGAQTHLCITFPWGRTMPRFHPSRRNFLKAAGAAAGAALLSPPDLLTQSPVAVAPPSGGPADYTLTIATKPIELAPNRIVSVTTYNGQYPGDNAIRGQLDGLGGDG